MLANTNTHLELLRTDKGAGFILLSHFLNDQKLCIQSDEHLWNVKLAYFRSVTKGKYFALTSTNFSRASSSS